MRQTFDVRGGPEIGRKNLPLLRNEMRVSGLDYFYIPHEDEYQNEYLPDANERLAWATGFTGSAGAAIIGHEGAFVFVDGRYTLQAADQLDHDLFEVNGLPEPGPFGWLAEQKLDGVSVGYDPKLLSPNDLSALERAATRAGADLVAVQNNPIDIAWADRPIEPIAPVVPHPIELAGVSSADKRLHIADALASQQIDATVITSPASIAWALNIRGGDVMCTPLPLGRAILYRDGTADLFLNKAKVTDRLVDHLGNGVTLRSVNELEAALEQFDGKTVGLDPATASAWFFEKMADAGAKILRQQDPCAIPKACKNQREIEGTKRAHLRDGAALTKFLHWLDTEAQSGDVTEIEAVIKLETLRDQTGQLSDLSFETISGAGPNGAVVHYRVSTATDRKLERGSLFLVDSGGQYTDGTTDVTRTVPIGEASAEMAERYTLVLKGHIALAAARFPKGTTGTHLDILARHALWQSGLDYEHGTGHGVGVYLGVHEGPQRIAKIWNATPLQPGMIVSNEPGYYKSGAYGIRIENLQFVTEPQEIPGGDIAMLGFENLTFAPLARKLIRLDLVTKSERDWIDNYHRDVWDKIGPSVEGEVKDWLEAACAPL
ncbi:MAG: aminopeptidase P family protein [Pseudomonadota bacterium]